ncbi:MAG: hypothetical protein ACI4CA_07375 [Bacteroides sp.]
MKTRLFSFVCALVASVTLSPLFAQSDNGVKMGIFNHLSVGASASTLGYGFDVALPLTPYLAIRGGVEIMPSITFDTDVDADFETSAGGYSTSVNLEGDTKRTQSYVIANIYPFKRSSFFLAAGAYFGGGKVVGVHGQSDELRNLMQQYPSVEGGVVIGDYTLPVERDGSVSGSIDVKKFRPYFGLGFGRSVPYRRVGFAFEMGVQLHGTPQVKDKNGSINDLISSSDADDDFSEIVDKLTVYPVIKFRLTGRIF